MILSIDGVQFDIKAKLTRQADIKASDISGMMLNKSYLNDVLGTYMSFSLQFEYPLYSQSKYARLYEMLTDPVDGHQFVLPYNNSTIALTARVETLQDDLLEFDNGAKYWRNCAFAIIANHESKSMTLSQVIARGMTPLPDVDNPQIGDTYTWDGSEWDDVPDADNISY